MSSLDLTDNVLFIPKRKCTHYSTSALSVFWNTRKIKNKLITIYFYSH